MAEDLVWYACYGSNLLKSRFLCYIKGGKPEGASEVFNGCPTNRDEPTKDRVIIIPHELYFSKTSSSWQNLGVAFIKSKQDRTAETLGRMYLITKEQFICLLCQENSCSVNSHKININFSIVKQSQEVFIGKNEEFTWYGRIIYLGDMDGYPILTITAKRADNEIIYNVPSNNYLGTIIRGLKETYRLSNEKIVDYLRGKSGIKEKIEKTNLKKIVEIYVER